ncbi:uncharacterized protein VTP21DRAFT_8380 [Calcarisporiella thermophila]|uniref:uncharacterized protein n=1 Tax=Calcarisporiella thermophila TaxID=911321 RepID=UPI003743D951
MGPAHSSLTQRSCFIDDATHFDLLEFTVRNGEHNSINYKIQKGVICSTMPQWPLEFVQVSSKGECPSPVLLPKIIQEGDTRVQFKFFVGTHTPRKLGLLIVPEEESLTPENLRIGADNLEYTSIGSFAQDGEYKWEWSIPKIFSKELTGRSIRIAFVEQCVSSDTYKVLAQFDIWLQSTQQQRDTLHLSPCTPSSDSSSPRSSYWSSAPRIFRRFSWASISSEYTTVSQEAVATPAATVCHPVTPPPSPISGSDTTPFIEDGPVFRKTLHELELSSIQLKKQVKKVLRAAEVSLQAHKTALEANTNLLDEMRPLAPMKPLFTTFLDQVADKVAPLQEITKELKFLVIDPLSTVYQQHLQHIESYKKKFDDESKAYYAWLSRYLARTGVPSHTSEAKFQIRRAKFELSRIGYYKALCDLNTGRVNLDIRSGIEAYCERYATHVLGLANQVSNLTPALEELRAETTSAMCRAKAIETQYTEHRTLLEAKLELPLPVEEEEAHAFSKEINISPNGIYEGFLFATSKPQAHAAGAMTDVGFKHAWRMYWCTITEDGYLREYIHWQRQPELHNSPIDLRLAIVREALDQDRHFCFEVVTPRFRRIFQASCVEDMYVWIQTIRTAIKHKLNRNEGVDSSNTVLDVDDVQIQAQEHLNQQKRKNRASRLFSSASLLRYNTSRKRKLMGGSTEAMDELSALIVAPIPQSNMTGKAMVAREPVAIDVVKPNDCGKCIDEFTPGGGNDTELLHLLWQVPGNRHCAECAAPDPQWCSINLGILFCIECSGIHRSLGPHISKVRSLTLDTMSFTPEIIALLQRMGNEQANQIWEACINGNSSTPKPGPFDERKIKHNFIVAKYVEKAYVSKFEDFAESPTDMLYRAIRAKDIPLASKAIAHGAELNATLFRNELGKSNSSEEANPIDSVCEPVIMDEKLLPENVVSSSPLQVALTQSTSDITTIPVPLIANLGTQLETQTTEENSGNNSNVIAFGQSEINQDNTVCGLTQFSLAELLILNGADLDSLDTTDLDAEAIAYINTKKTLRGQLPIDMCRSPSRLSSVSHISASSTKTKVEETVRSEERE